MLLWLLRYSPVYDLGEGPGRERGQETQQYISRLQTALIHSRHCGGQLLRISYHVYQHTCTCRYEYMYIVFIATCTCMLLCWWMYWYFVFGGQKLFILRAGCELICASQIVRNTECTYWRRVVEAWLMVLNLPRRKRPLAVLAKPQFLLRTAGAHVFWRPSLSKHSLGIGRSPVSLKKP